jgi:hypothetical protein
MSTWRDVDYIESRNAEASAAVGESMSRARTVGVETALLDEFMEAAKAMVDAARKVKSRASAIVQNERGFRK